MENSVYSQMFYGDSQDTRFTHPSSNEGDADEDNEDCPVPAAPGADFLPASQLDPFIDFEPSQIFRSSQNRTSKDNVLKEIPNESFRTPSEKTKPLMVSQSQRRQLFKPPTKANHLTKAPGKGESPIIQSNSSNDNSVIRSGTLSDSAANQEFSLTQPGSNVQIVSPSTVPALKKKYYTPSPLVLNQGQNAGVELKSTKEIAEKYRCVFPFPYFNIVQTKVFDEIFYKDSPIVVCAPTGAGKTVVFELAIIRLLMKTEHTSLGANFKIVYMAPIKALCSERCTDWSEKFERFGLKCRELTGDSELDDYYQLQQVNIIFTTPEKWDSMTRRWRDNTFIVQSICLFLIDEVHVLSDASRGATMEAVISRMKTIQASMNRCPPGSLTPRLRFVAVSATIPNIQDIAEWLGDKFPAVNFNMDDSLRPVRLRKVVLGFPFYEQKGSDFQFDMSLSYKLARIINTYSDNKPTLVVSNFVQINFSRRHNFCSTRKSTQQAAEILVKDIGSTYIKTYFQRQALQTCANSLKDNKLRDLVARGVGYHHAGLDVHDRKAIEEIFLEGQLMVLVATSTLAMGVNLPAHLVVLKSTSYYNLGVHVEYSDTQILQMIGRAGRPQFDTSATAVIMTKNQTKEKYVSLVNGTQLIESSLHKNLIEHLNAEIVLHTINDISIAMEWIRYTFLYIRVMKNPKHYGMPLGMNREQIEKRLQELCMRNLNLLNTHGMITMDDETIDVKSTEPGKLMARYCIAFETMRRFSKLGATETTAELLYEMCGCDEFSEVQLRNNEKKTLNTFNRDKNRVTVRFPVTGKVKTKQMKVNILIQVALGCLLLQDFSLQQDTTRIFRAAQRMSRCLVELLWLKDEYKSLLSGVQLMKCLKARLWEDSRHVSKQLDGIGPALSNALVNAGMTTFQKISDTNPRELELIVNRHPPFGNQLRDMVSGLPKYELTIEQVSKYSEDTADIVVHLVIANPEQVSTRRTLPENHTCVLLIGDEDNRVVYKRKIMDAYLLKEHGITKKLEVRRSEKGPNLFINLISQEWVGLDVQSTYTPYYIGAKKISNNANSLESVQTSQPTQTPSVSSAGTEECGHRCVNKAMCGHDCCRNGVNKRKTPKTRPKTPQVPKHKPMDSYVSTLKDRVSQTPNIAKRLKMAGNNTFGTKLDFNRFAYSPQKRKVTSSRPRQLVQNTNGDAIEETCLDELEILNSRGFHTAQANKDIAPSCSKDWTDLDIYLKHNTVEDEMPCAYEDDDQVEDELQYGYGENQNFTEENETDFERFRSSAGVVSKSKECLKFPTPRFGEVFAWSNDKENIGPCPLSSSRIMQKSSRHPWGLNQDTLDILSCSDGYVDRNRTSDLCDERSNHDSHADMDCYIQEQNWNINPPLQTSGKKPKYIKNNLQCCPRISNENFSRFNSKNKLNTMAWDGLECQRDKTVPDVLDDKSKSSAVEGDWSGSDSDLMIVDDQEFRDSLYCKNSPEEKTRVTSNFSHSVQDDVCQNMYSVGSNYCEKSEKLRKAEREMEIFLFGSDAESKMETKDTDTSNGYTESKESGKCPNKVLTLNDRDIIHQKPQDFQQYDEISTDVNLAQQSSACTPCYGGPRPNRETFSSIFDALF